MEKLIKFVLCWLLSQGCIAGEVPMFPHLFASGHLERNVMPEIARVEVSIVVFDPASEVAMQNMNQAMDRVISVIVSLGIEEEAFTATEIDKRMKQNRTDRYELPEILGYEVARSLTVQLNDLEKYPELVNRVSATDYVARISATFDIKERQRLEDSLEEEAAKKAIRNAEHLASSEGIKLLEIYSISNSNSYWSNDLYLAPPAAPSDEEHRYPRMAYVESTGSIKTYVPQSIRVSRSVSLVYRTKP